MYRHLRGSLIGVSVLLALTGCTLGPNYLKPDVDLPLAFKDGAPWKAATPQDQLAKGKWWEVYGDPVLNRLEEQATEANQDLAAAFARLTQARAVARIDQADRLPRLGLNASASRVRTAQDFSVSGEGDSGNRFSVPLDLSYEIDLWGRVRRSVEASYADVQASQADYLSLLLSLQAEVAGNYFALRSLDAEIDLLQRTARLRRENLDLINSLFKNGEVGQLDVSRAETELASTQAEAIGLEKARSELEHNLAVLTAKPASTFSLPAHPLDIEVPSVAPGLPSSLLERRPDIARAERQMAAANARIGVAKTAFFPAISLTGSAGYVSTEASGLFGWDNRTWALGPAISLPIFEAGRNAANLERARAVYEEAVARYRQQVLLAFADVEDALAGLRILNQQGAAQQLAVEAARQAADISGKRYRAGLVSYLEVVDSQRTALQAEQLWTRIVGQRLQSSVLLVKALGGGWDDSGVGL